MLGDINIESINGDVLSDDKKAKRPSMPKALKEAVFRKYCESLDNAMCFVGCGEKITPFNFECGHVIAHVDGGPSTIDNLRPVCSRCNRSMGVKNMDDFIRECGFKNDIQLNVKETDKNKEYDKVMAKIGENIRTQMSYICQVCSKQLSSERTLIKHMDGPCQRKLEKQLEKKCPTCLVIFSTLQKLRSHLENEVCTKNKGHILQQKIPLKMKEKSASKDYENMSKEELIAKLEVIDTEKVPQQQIINNTVNVDNRVIDNSVNNTQQVNIILPPLNW